MIIIQHRANTIKKFNETSNAFGCRKCILGGPNFKIKYEDIKRTIFFILIIRKL